MLDKNNRRMDFLFGKGFDSNPSPEIDPEFANFDESLADGSLVDEDGLHEYANWDIVVKISNIIALRILLRAGRTRRTPQSIMREFLTLGCIIDKCFATGDFSELEKQCGLTRYEKED